LALTVFFDQFFSPFETLTPVEELISASILCVKALANNFCFFAQLASILAILLAIFSAYSILIFGGFPRPFYYINPVISVKNMAESFKFL
jgi:hypothetical protein